MANIREIQTRINSVKDTMKITNAMYLISSTKMRQARKKLADFINCRLRLPESCVICRK